VLSVRSRRSSLSEFQAVGPATANARADPIRAETVKAQRGNDAWQNKDVVDWLHHSSPSSTGEPYDEGSYAPLTRA